MRREVLRVIGWLAAAAASVVACQMAVVHATPIDDALPLLAVIVTVLAAVSHPSVQLAVPLLVLAEIGIADETTRLVVFGLVIVGAWCCAGLRPAFGRGTEGGPEARTAPAPEILAVTAIVLLRWLPLSEVLWFREIALLAIAVVIVRLMQGTPLGVAVAVLTALITPAVPLRTFALPLIVLIVAAVARPNIKLTVPSIAAVAIALTFFAWSGLVARAFPYFLKETKTAKRYTVNAALAPNRSVTLDVPPEATALIVSGANVPHLRRGALLGRIEPGAIDVRIGDAADWGYLRRENFYAARNPLPRQPAGLVRGYGYTAWLDGGGRVALPRNAKTIRVTADAHLPANARLQVEAFALEGR